MFSRGRIGAPFGNKNASGPRGPRSGRFTAGALGALGGASGAMIHGVIRGTRGKPSRSLSAGLGGFIGGAAMGSPFGPQAALVTGAITGLASAGGHKVGHMLTYRGPNRSFRVARAPKARVASRGRRR